MYDGPVREGNRGGQGDFRWSAVVEDKHRENYLGHSVQAPQGRWQKNKDIHWYTRDNAPANEEQAAREKREELKRLKEAEEEALSVALGFAPKKKADGEGDGGGVGTGANGVPVKKGEREEEFERLEKEERKREKALRKEERALKRVEREVQREEREREREERRTRRYEDGRYSDRERDDRLQSHRRWRDDDYDSDPARRGRDRDGRHDRSKRREENRHDDMRSRRYVEDDRIDRDRRDRDRERRRNSRSRERYGDRDRGGSAKEGHSRPPVKRELASRSPAAIRPDRSASPERRRDSDGANVVETKPWIVDDDA